MKRILTFVLVLALVTLTFDAPATAKPKFSTPTLSAGTATATSAEVIVCAGATGAPAGFSLQWLSKEELDALGGIWPGSTDPLLCKGSFSGNANLSTYNLAANACVTVQLGDNLFDAQGASSNCASLPLECGKTYAVRTFAHANSTYNRSDFSAPFLVSTLACTEDFSCTYTQGFWKTHGPIPSGNNGNEWPVGSLTLGAVAYTDLQLQSIFDQPAQGNGLIALAHQLIATKLNLAKGADAGAIQTAINAADALIGSLVVPPVGSGALSPASTSSLTATLASYNEGLTGPGHCL